MADEIPTPGENFDTLQDFTSANVRVIPPSLVKRPQSVIAGLQDFSAASQEEDFQTVRNGAKPKGMPRKLQTSTTLNRFQVLRQSSPGRGGERSFPLAS